MAQINHNNAFKTISDLIENAKEQNTLHLYAEDAFLTGSSLQINGKKCWHFATTGYLGLEQDIRLKRAGAEAIMNYGTQFPLSKTYISHPLYAELESLLEQMYEQEVIVCKNSTLAHLGIIPQLIAYDDVVVLDHQVHWSVQQACSLLKNKGCVVEMIRHNDLGQLENLLIKYKNKKRKIWYMADGIYSMYGDHAPIASLKVLMDKYQQLYLYFDDVHGMSWKGVNGTGFIKTHWHVIPENMVLVTTLSKTFGASGAIVLCGDKQKHTEIKNFGGPLTFSAQLEPAGVAAAIASAKIHLSAEIYQLQDKLKGKINRANELFKHYKLPIISFAETPVFYLGTALPQTTYNLVNRLHSDGFFVNPGLYPAVPMRNAGLRITVSNHNDDDHIEALVKSISNHFDAVLTETNNSKQLIQKAFKLSLAKEQPIQKNKKYELCIWKSIHEIDENLWNNCLGDENPFDYQGFKWIEDTFGALSEEHLNYMSFKYYGWFLNEECVALTAVSEAIWKEDVLATVYVSNKIEEIRKETPLFLCAKAWATASAFSEGKHVYIKDDDLEILETVLDDLLHEFETSDINKFFFRDFEANKLQERLFLNKGLVKIEMPHSAVFKWNNLNTFKDALSKKNKRNFNKEVLPYVNHFEICKKKQLANQQLMQAYELYAQVKNKNTAINDFMYDFCVFEKMNEDDNWEFIIATLPHSDVIIGCVFCYVNHYNKSFNPLLIGLYDEVDNRLKLYRQLLYKTIVFSKEMQFETIYFGLSAVFEKRKLGSEIFYKYAYVLAKETFDLDQLAQFEN